MAEPVIKVEGLGKKYIIGHQGKGGYKTIRDQIGDGVKTVFSKTKKMLSGQIMVEGDEMEDFWALKDISFEVKQGDTLGIIGRNGAGKSTLLKILSRITEPTTGRVNLKGRVASLLEVGTGFHPELSGRENIFLNGAILGMSRAEIKRKFDEIVDFSGVEKFLDTPVKRFSSGMYVRLAFSVAAHLEPEILIVDEVLAVGDTEFQKKCMGRMRDVSKNDGRTVLFVSHQMGSIAQLCNNCLLLKQGCIEAIGTPLEVIDKYYNQLQNDSYSGGNKDVDIFIKELFSCNENGDPKSNFAHSDNIHLRIKVGVNKFDPIQNIGIALLTRDKKRVFTVNHSFKNFYNGNAETIVDFIIEGGLIAPMDYSFLVALNTRTGLMTYDMQDDVCSIKIYDDGTEFAFAEGIDYGSIILKDKWKSIQ